MQNLLCYRLEKGVGAVRQARYLILLSGLFCLSAGQVFAQIPLPGNQSAVDLNQNITQGSQISVSGSAPAPGSAPVPGQWQAAAAKATSAYQQLPLTQSEAEMRVEDLKLAMASTPPANIQESIFQLGEWLADMADAHNKMAAAFSKRDTTKREAQAERLAAQKFNMLRNQIQLLKAELLIRQHRYPEALQPLVDIVVAEPTSATGLAAYQHLRDIGFSQVPQGVPITQPLQATPDIKSEGKVALPKTGGEILPESQTTETSDLTPSPIHPKTNKVTAVKTAAQHAVLHQNWQANAGLAHNLKKPVSPSAQHVQGQHLVSHASLPKVNNKSIAGLSKPAEKVWITGTPMGR